MNRKEEWRTLFLIVGMFLLFFYLPVGSSRFENAILESLYLAKWYAREHVLLCLVPAFFIAGAIATFISQNSVMKYLGAGAKKVLAYSVASVSGTILAVCSCTVLPLFAGIYRMGAGLGPATAFLYSGPAINVLAIILTARILGFELGIARVVGAILFSIVIGLAMHTIFREEEKAKETALAAMPEPEVERPLWKNVIYFALMVAILVIANWGRTEETSGLWYWIYTIKWDLTGIFSVGFGISLVAWFGLHWSKVVLVALPTFVFALLFPQYPLISFTIGIIGLSIITSTHRGETSEWFGESWGFAKQILPLLFLGVLVAGIFLGRPGQEGLIPSEWISRSVGGNSLQANLFASIAGAFMYFATLTEVPILQGLIGNGMGKGPALALLLAGPALSLPNMLVIRSVMGNKKTFVYIVLVIVLSMAAGMIYGSLISEGG
jgi:uncharacterized membrane protein YraQ (UPF0718 family)